MKIDEQLEARIREWAAIAGISYWGLRNAVERVLAGPPKPINWRLLMNSTRRRQGKPYSRTVPRQRKPRK